MDCASKQMGTPNPSVSVIIPNFNGRSLLEANIPGVKAMLRTCGICDSEIIVPDDASTDDSAVFLKRCHPDVILIEGMRNLGFSGNVNRGIVVATKQLVLLLNSDVAVPPGYLIPQLPYFQRCDTFGVMAAIRSEGADVLLCGAKYPRTGVGGIKGTENYLCPSRGPEGGQLTFFLSGANALMDRAKLQEIGGFCELFNPYYSEDVDLGLRAWKAGYRCYFEPSESCRHAISSTIRKQPARNVQTVVQRNKLLLNFLHLDGFARRVYFARQWLKASFARLVGKGIHWESWRAFRELGPAALAAKQAFSELQRKKGLRLQTRDVRDLIIDSVRGVNIHRF